MASAEARRAKPRPTSISPPADGPGSFRHELRTPTAAAAGFPAGGLGRPSFTSGRTPDVCGHSHSTVAELQEACRLLCGKETAISPAMLLEAMSSVGQQPTEEEVKAMVHAVDQRGGGNITFPEFAALLGMKIEMAEVEEMRAAFIALDKGSTGMVTTAQFSELFATMGDCSSPEEVEEMLRFADPKSSGKIDYDMFLATLAYRMQ